MGINLLEVCLSIRKGYFMSDSSFVVKHVLIKIMKKLPKQHYTQASLIAGLEYGMEQWNGKWNGAVNVQSCS